MRGIRLPLVNGEYMRPPQEAIPGFGFALPSNWSKWHFVGFILEIAV
jgi:hypothetical protein